MYEILYLIYFYIDDYDTACNFWLLNKEFTFNYMKIYNKNYEYKFSLLLKYFHTFLKNPEIKTINLHNYTNNINNIKFCYNLYKKALFNEFTKVNIKINKKNNWSNLTMYYIFYGGLDILNLLFKIKCIKNNVKIHSLSYKKINLLKNISYNVQFNVYFIKNYKNNIENALNI